MSEYRQRRTPAISSLFKFLLKTTQVVRNGSSAEQRHKRERRESLRAGCRWQKDGAASSATGAGAWGG